MFNSVSEMSPPSIKALQNGQQIPRRAYVRIVEQPASKALRFRYECEGRSAGSIPGASSTPENKTYPSIQVVGFQGKAVVVVSCVTKDKPHKPHPHNLVGREGCKRGVCTMEISQDTMSIQFSNLGIQCVKKKDIEAALRVREEIRVDPYRTGFDHRNQPTSIDLNVVRLCFQVFLEGETKGKFTVPLPPVVSEPIYDKKAMSDLVIVKMSDYETTADGGRKDIILLCEKVAKEDIQVRFYEEKEGILIWEGLGDFQPTQVHKQTAIWFRPPRYHTLDIIEPVRVNVQLKRPSDGVVSEPQIFDYYPLDGGLKRKRTKFDGSPHLPGQEIGIGNEPQYGVLPVKLEPNDNYQYNTTHHMYGGMVEVQDQRVSIPTPSPEIPDHVKNHENMTSLTVPTTTWNVPFPQEKITAVAVEAVINNPNNVGGLVIDTSSFDSGKIGNILNLDNQRTELEQITLNSGELEYNIDDLSETLNTNLSLSNINPKDQSMSDSLKTHINNTIDKICQERQQY